MSLISFNVFFFLLNLEIVCRWQAATNFYPHSARHAFPCYDNINYRANFQLSIVHSSSFNSLANAESMGRADLPNGNIRSNFQYTNAIAPSSLAFFVMSSLNFVQQTKNIGSTEHIVSLRETEASFTEKFFNSLDVLVAHVELMLNSTLPSGSSHLHHVALPDFMDDVRGFYKFNYYR